MTNAISYATWLENSINLLLNSQTLNDRASAKLDAVLLLSAVTGKNSAQILAFAETSLTVSEIEGLSALLRRRLTGEPIAYLLGKQGFWSLDLLVTKDTLIPRADTEILVETALTKAHDRLAEQKTINILDLGTGTGAIILALANELNKIYPTERICMLAVDFLESVVQLAQRNAILNNINNIEFQRSNWFTQLEKKQKFDIIVSNPPYIDINDPHLQQDGIKFEPNSALIAKQQGLADLYLIITKSTTYINKKGWLLLEHGYQQAKDVRTKMLECGWQQPITIKDYAGNDRVTLAYYI